jgi:excisionase family DNA binding protein
MVVDDTAGAVPERMAVGLSDGAKQIGLGRAQFCKLVYSGEISSFKVGRRRLIPVDALRAFIAKRVAATAQQVRAA